ncbi:MAG TPA: N4-gp56 family major capsid protein [Fluviicoccus sp.]|nr:N4-gp56 family major capsid protein [Fluviicoccus sp.]
MATTSVPFGDPKAQKKWSANLAVDTRKKSYFENRFIGTDDNSIIQRKTELESDAGDRISFDLCVQMRNKPTYGDARLEGKEESLKFYTDEVIIDQVRHAVSAGGKMSRKRTSHDMRLVAKGRLGDYFARLVDEFFFIYLSGARGINEDFIESTAFTGFANNPLQAPDSDHLLYGGDAVSKATLEAADIMTRNVIERAVNKALMMQARNPETANMVPVSNGSEEQYVCVMSPDQEYSLRTSDAGGWIDIQKAAAAAEGRNNPIFKGGLGMINNTVLHKHRSAIRFSDYGAGANLPAARALFMGRQAAVVAYGTSGGLRYSWEENTKDYGNEPTVASGFLGGIKKTRFNGRDFGVISIDTYAKDPNAA